MKETELPLPDDEGSRGFVDVTASGWLAAYVEHIVEGDIEEPPKQARLADPDE